jgi:ketosteroid isomerase-like protein
MDLLRRLEAIEDIKQLKARYARHVDAKRWDALADLFTEDAALQHPHLGTVTGRAHIVSAISASIDDASFSHHVGMPDIDVVADSTARGVWSVIVLGHRRDTAGDWVDESRTEYHEDYRKGADGSWRIARTRSVPMIRVSLAASVPPRIQAACEGSET